MNTWDSLTASQAHDFRLTMQAWLDLRICSACALAKRAGLSTRTVYDIAKGKNTTNRTANEIMQAIGQLERAYIKQWRDRRVQNES